MQNGGHRYRQESFRGFDETTTDDAADADDGADEPPFVPPQLDFANAMAIRVGDTDGWRPRPEDWVEVQQTDPIIPGKPRRFRRLECDISGVRHLRWASPDMCLLGFVTAV